MKAESIVYGAASQVTLTTRKLLKSRGLAVTLRGWQAQEISMSDSIIGFETTIDKSDPDV